MTMIRLSYLQHSLKNFKTSKNSQLILQMMALYVQMKMLLLQKHIFWKILKSFLELLKRSLMQQNKMTRIRKMM